MSWSVVLVYLTCCFFVGFGDDYSEENTGSSASLSLTPVEFITLGRVAETVHKASQLEDELRKLTQELDLQGRQLDLLVDSGCGGEQLTEYLLDQRSRRKRVNLTHVLDNSTNTSTASALDDKKLNNATASTNDVIVTSSTMSSAATTSASKKTKSRSRRNTATMGCISKPKRETETGSVNVMQNGGELLKKQNLLENRIFELEKQLKNVTSAVFVELTSFEDQTSQRIELLQAQIDDLIASSRQRHTDIININASLTNQLEVITKQINEQQTAFENRVIILEQKMFRERESPMVSMISPMPLTMPPLPSTKPPNILQKAFQAKENFLKDIGVLPPSGLPKIPFLSQFQGKRR